MERARYFGDKRAQLAMDESAFMASLRLLSVHPLAPHVYWVRGLRPPAYVVSLR